MSETLALVLPLAAAGLATVVALVLDGLGRSRSAPVVAGLLLVAGAIPAGIAATTLEPSKAFGFFILGAGYSGAVCVVLTLAAFSAVVAGASASSERGTLVALIAFSALAANGLVAAPDPLFMLVALETLAVLGYAIVSVTRTPKSSEAAIKYFVQGTVATAIYALGLAGLLGAGLSLLSDVDTASAAHAAGAGPVTAACALIVVAFSFKLGAFPFHSWAPDAYEAAPPAGTAFIASATKVAAFTALYTITATLVEPAGVWAEIRFVVAAAAAASVVFGNLAALSQKSYARMLAFSGIAQVGYGLTGVVTGNGSATLLFVVAYAIASAGAFAAIESVRARRPRWDGSIAGLSGLASEAPILSASLAAILFSMTGIPPLVGFWGKFMVFLTAAGTGWTWLVVIGVLGSVVSFGYYGRVLRHVYFEEAPETGDVGLASPSSARGADLIVIVLAAVIVALGVFLLVNGLVALIGGADSSGFFGLVPPF